MTILSPDVFEAKILDLGFSMEHFQDPCTIRILPPKHCYCLNFPCGKDMPFSLTNLNCTSDVFYCVGREQIISLPIIGKTKASALKHCRYVRHPVSITCDELCRIINEMWQYRNNVSDDFYAISLTGAFMIYVSHHDEILLYFGWRSCTIENSCACKKL